MTDILGFRTTFLVGSMAVEYFVPLPPMEPAFAARFVKQIEANFEYLRRQIEGGISTTVALAKLTSGGSNGSATYVNGVLTAYTAPT